MGVRVIFSEISMALLGTLGSEAWEASEVVELVGWLEGLVGLVVWVGSLVGGWYGGVVTLARSTL